MNDGGERGGERPTGSGGTSCTVLRAKTVKAGAAFFVVCVCASLFGCIARELQRDSENGVDMCVCVCDVLSSSIRGVVKSMVAVWSVIVAFLWGGHKAVRPLVFWLRFSHLCRCSGLFTLSFPFSLSHSLSLNTAYAFRHHHHHPALTAYIGTLHI